MSGLPGPGRDRVSLLRLWLSYKITASKAIGKYPVEGGKFVPFLKYGTNKIKLEATRYLHFPKRIILNEYGLELE